MNQLSEELRRARQLDNASEDLERFAHRLVDTRFAGHIGARDVLVWRSTKGELYIAFRGPARKLERLFENDLVPGGAELDAELQRAGGVPAVIVPKRWGKQLESPLGQLVPDGDISYVDALSAVTTVARHVIQDEDEDFKVHVTLMPSEGEPPSAFDFDAYYSTATRQRKHGEMPPVRMVAMRNIQGAVTLGEEKTLVADVCGLTRPMPDVDGPLSEILEYRRRRFRWFVTHSFSPVGRGGDPDRRVRMDLAGENALSVEECGGWLYPSLGVGTVIATKFGPVTLVAGTQTITQIFGGASRGMSNWPVTLYATDSWTVRTPEILTRGARRLLEQLTGIAEYDYGDDAHQWILGPPVESSTLRGEIAPPITTKRRFDSVLGQRAQHWLQQGGGNETDHYYPYLEAKVSRIVPPSWWKAVIVAESWEDEARVFMAALGMDQPVFTVPGPRNEGWWHPTDEEAFVFSQKVAEQIEGIGS